MPDLNFKVLGVTAAARGLVPLLHFKIEIVNRSSVDQIQSVMLHAQIQVQSPQRSYNPSEKAKLRELFGRAEEWGRTLRNKLWTHASTVVGSFEERTETALPVPCTFDLNIGMTKYFYALEEGEIPLLFLFSGTIFYSTGDGPLQIQRVPWEKEAIYRMPVATWRGLMEIHFANTVWISLHRDVFDQFYEFKRETGCKSWEEAMAMLLENAPSVAKS